MFDCRDDSIQVDIAVGFLTAFAMLGGAARQAAGPGEVIGQLQRQFGQPAGQPPRQRNLPAIDRRCNRRAEL